MSEIVDNVLGDCGCQCRQRFTHKIEFVKEWYGYNRFDLNLDPLNTPITAKWRTFRLRARIDFGASGIMEFDSSITFDQLNGWMSTGPFSWTLGGVDMPTGGFSDDWTTYEALNTNVDRLPGGGVRTWTTVSPTALYWNSGVGEEVWWELSDPYTLVQLEQDVNNMYGAFNEFEPWDPAVDPNTPQLDGQWVQVQYDSSTSYFVDPTWLRDGAAGCVLPDQSSSEWPLPPLPGGSTACLPYFNSGATSLFPAAKWVYDFIPPNNRNPARLVLVTVCPLDPPPGVSCPPSSGNTLDISGVGQWNQPGDGGNWAKARVLFRWPRGAQPASLCTTTVVNSSTEVVPNQCRDETFEADNPALEHLFKLLRPPPNRSTANLIFSDFWAVTTTLTEDASTTGGGCPCA